MPTSYVMDMCSDVATGLDGELRSQLDDDAAMLGRLGVSSERERNLAFYLDHFLDEFCEESGLPVPSDRDKVLAKAFGDLRHEGEVDLADIRGAFCGAMAARRKVAYPNTAGVMEINRKTERDVSKWVRTLGEIHAAGRLGVSRDSAMRGLTEEWDPVEKRDFEQWLRYYEHGDHEKYAAEQQQVLQPPPAGQQAVQPPLATRPRGRMRVENRSLEENRKALISRLDSAKKLLRLFAPPVWPKDRWDSVYRALADLEHEITSLRTASSMRDRIVRTARLFDKAGFAAGADTLRRIAQPPDEDVASQIEKALTGREYDIGKPGGAVDVPPPPDAGLPPAPAGEAMPPAPAGSEAMTSPPQGEEALPPPGMPPEAMNALPEPPPVPGPEAEKKPAKDENPYAGSTAKDVLDALEPLMKRFKEREIVRQLSKVDMMMDSLNIVAYFPELGEAIGRLIETDSYVGTRLEKIIGKLRGGLKEEEGGGGEKKPVPPSVDMGPGQAEETAVTVSEKAPPEPAKPGPTEETAVTVSEKAPPAPGA
jgi:hypothetical protein